MTIEVISRTQYDGGIDLGSDPVWQCPPDIQAGDLLLLLETQWGSYWIDDAGHPNGGYNFLNFPAGVIELQGALQGGGFSSFFGYKFATDASDSNGTITVSSNIGTNNWATTLIQVRGLDPSVAPINAGVSDAAAVQTRNPLAVSGLTNGTTYFSIASIVPYGSPTEALSDGNITGQDHKFVQHQVANGTSELSDLGVSEYHNHVASGGAWQAGGFWNTWWVAALLKSACFEALAVSSAPPTIFLGSNPIGAGSLKLGGSDIAKVYHGASEIWPPVPPGPPPTELTFVDVVQNSERYPPEGVLTIPATAQAGDLLVYTAASAFGMDANQSGSVDLDFWERHDESAFGYKVLLASDIGETVGGTWYNNDNNIATATIWRPDNSINSVSYQDNVQSQSYSDNSTQLDADLTGVPLNKAGVAQATNANLAFGSAISLDRVTNTHPTVGSYIFQTLSSVFNDTNSFSSFHANVAAGTQYRSLLLGVVLVE